LGSLLLCLITVSIIAIPGRGHLRAEYLLAGIGIAVALLSGRTGRFRLLGGELALLGTMFASGLLSIAVYYVTHSDSATVLADRDVLSVARFPTYAGFMLVGAALAPADPRQLGRLRVTLSALAALSCLMSVAQYFDLLGLNHGMARLYTPESLARGDLDLVLGGGVTRRIAGTLGNPNWWGWWLLALATFAYSWAASSSLVRGLPLLVGLSVALLLTGSRTSLVSLVVGITAASFALGRAMGAQYRRASVGILVTATMIGSGWIGIQTVYEAQDRYSVQNIDSLYARFRLWQEGTAIIAENPILGTGPRKSELLRTAADARRATFVDNAYLAVLARFGFVGLALYLAFLVWVSVHALRAANSAPNGSRWWPAATFGAWAASWVFGLAADMIFAVQPMLLLSLFHGVSIGISGASPVGSRLRSTRATAAASLP